MSSRAPHSFLRRFFPPLARFVSSASTSQPRSSAAASASRIEKSSQRKSDRTRRRRAAPITPRSAALRSAGSSTSFSFALPAFGRRPGDILNALLAVAHQLRAQVFERIGRFERRQILRGGFVALGYFAGLEEDAVHGKHLMHVCRWEMPFLGDDFNLHLARPL